MIIKNALIHDAIHEEPFYGDIVIENGKIVSVGGDAGKDGDVIDAEGLHAYPGFVDAHSHIGLDAYGGPTGGTFDINEMNDIILLVISCIENSFADFCIFRIWFNYYARISNPKVCSSLWGQ